jgi:hypothetical protein
LQHRLLTRDQFREQVLARHGGRCCVPGCGQQAVDAHHIFNRNLFRAAHELGGYFVANGANLCSVHHLDAEQTRITVADLWAWCGVTDPILPEHLATDTGYDTWGNPVTADGRRLPGELFWTEACQKALGLLVHAFDTRVKYPRTLHLPWSPGVSADDKVQHDLTVLQDHEVVVTKKMDGENGSIYSDGYTHARSTSSGPHPSRDHLRALAARIAYDLPAGWRIVGENLWAQHSIAYRDLPAHFQVISIWDRDRCLSWDETEGWCALLDLVTVPVLYRGPMLTQDGFARLFAPHVDTDEGYVVRVAEEFRLADFQRVVAKWVRAEHVTTGEHWMNQQMTVNGLAPRPTGIEAR